MESTQLMDDIISQSTKQANLHSSLSNRLAVQSRWLKFIVNGGNIVMGSAGCATFFTQLSNGTYDWSSLILGGVLIITGLGGAIADSCQLTQRSTAHDVAADRYETLANDIEMIKSIPKVTKEVNIAIFSTRLSAINADAPFVDEKKSYC